MAEIEFKDNKELENPTLKEVVEEENELKSFLVNYVGKRQDPNNEEVTVEMIVETLAEDFPEFMLAVAEENWIRGYHQALTDVDYGKEIVEESEEDNCETES